MNYGQIPNFRRFWGTRSGVRPSQVEQQRSPVGGHAQVNGLLLGQAQEWADLAAGQRDRQQQGLFDVGIGGLEDRLF